MFRGYDWDTIEGWRDREESASWRLDVLRSGEYELRVCYGRSVNSSGKIAVSLAENTFEMDPPPTGTPDVFKSLSLGRVSLPKGVVELKAQVAERGGTGEVLRLNKLFLRRVD